MPITTQRVYEDTVEVIKSLFQSGGVTNIVYLQGAIENVYKALKKLQEETEK